MAFSSIVLRILIASPSDLPEERDLVTDVVNEWTAQNSAAESFVLIPIKWETHSTPVAGIRPQEAINKQLVKDSDVLIGMFWTKFGTSTGVADSGTVEEIDQFVAANKPALLYFSRRPIDPSKIDVDQHKKLQEFKRDTYDKALVENFSSLGDLRLKVYRHLTNVVRELKGADFGGSKSGATPRLSTNAKDYGVSLGKIDKTFFKSPCNFHGTITRPLPNRAELWLFTLGEWSGDRAVWPQDPVVISGSEWISRYTPRNFKKGEHRSLRLFVVGEDGQALISAYRKINQHFATPPNQRWVGITKLTADIIPVGDPIEIIIDF